MCPRRRVWAGFLEIALLRAEQLLLRSTNANSAKPALAFPERRAPVVLSQHDVDLPFFIIAYYRIYMFYIVHGLYEYFHSDMVENVP